MFGRQGGKCLKTACLTKGRCLVSFPFSILFFLIILSTSTAPIDGEEAASVAPAVLNQPYEITEPEDFISRINKYMRQRWAWGVIDHVHSTTERTAQVHADRLGNRFILKTPLGGFLWGYEKTWGEAALFPKRDNIFGGRLHKQAFESGSQDLREYGYVFDTVRMSRWLDDPDDFPISLPVDATGHFIFTDSDAAISERPLVNFGSENFESIQAELNAHVNSGKWYGLGFNFMFIRHNPTTFGRFELAGRGHFYKKRW